MDGVARVKKRHTIEYESITSMKKMKDVVLGV